jgi:hypothetical protein
MLWSSLSYPDTCSGLHFAVSFASINAISAVVILMALQATSRRVSVDVFIVASVAGEKAISIYSADRLFYPFKLCTHYLNLSCILKIVNEVKLLLKMPM